MPFLRSFETTTIEVVGTVSSIIVVHSAPLMRLGIANALRIYASLHGKTIQQGSHINDVDAALRSARRGDVLIADVSCWTGLEKDTTGLRDRVRAEGVSIVLVAATDEGAHRLLQLRGVSGVVSPECDAGELEYAIGEVADGKTYFKHENRLAPATGMSKLSSRQVEILELMTRGLLNKQIAWELGVTEGTVKSHVSAILEKLGCDRRTQAIAAFLQSLGMGNQPQQASLHS
jgi:DNA-binding NarL/FixJ family response regulator